MKEQVLNEPGRWKLRNTLLIEEHKSITDEFLETVQEWYGGVKCLKCFKKHPL